MESSVYSDVRLIKCWKRTERVPLTLNNFLDIVSDQIRRNLPFAELI